MYTYTDDETYDDEDYYDEELPLEYVAYIVSLVEKRRRGEITMRLLSEINDKI